MKLNSRTTVVDYWFIVGNEDYSFAINIRDQDDVQYFTRDPDVNNDAFIRACGWCYPGIGPEVHPILPIKDFFKNYLDMLGIPSKMPTYKYPCEDADKDFVEDPETKDFIEDPETKDFFKGFFKAYFKSLGILPETPSNEDVTEKV